MKNFFFLILFFPLISIAQSDVTPKIACDLITDYERAKEFTLKYLNTMPADKYSYKPTPEILSFREEALHLAGGNYRYAAMIAGGYDATNFDENRMKSETKFQEQLIRNETLRKRCDINSDREKPYDSHDFLKLPHRFSIIKSLINQNDQEP